MVKTVVVADDLTGANATGVLLKQLGQKCVTVLSDASELDCIGLGCRADAVIIPTDSRGVEAGEAYQKVREITGLFSDQDYLFNKRIDSTLRGNVGAEIDAMADALGGPTAWVVPAYPASGRQCLGGFEMVDGVLLQNSFAGKDPKKPVKTSDVLSLIGEQSSKKLHSIRIDVIESGAEAVVEAAEAAVDAGAEVLVFDAMTDRHIGIIAEACIQSGKPFFTVCPGPFLRDVVKLYLSRRKDAYHARVLMTIGSVTDLTKQQIRYMVNRRKALFYKLDVMKVLGEADCSAYMEQIVGTIMSKVDGHTCICVTTVDLNEQFRVDLPAMAAQLDTTVESLSSKINCILADITKQLVRQDPSIKGLYTCGGDTTLAVARSFNTDALLIEGEVYPLAVSGTLMTDCGRALSVVTKGGMIGSEDGLVKVFDYLMKTMEEKEAAC